MKKKALSTLLAVSMVAGMVTGCGNSADQTAASTDTATTTSATEAAATTETTAATVAETPTDEGKVLNVYCWNDEFQRRVKAHYPGYEEVDATHGKIGGSCMEYHS